MIPTSTQWAKFLDRWAEVPESGERRLMVALLSSAIAAEIARWDEPEDVFRRDSYFRSGGLFDHHLSLIGIDAQFVRDQMLKFGPMRMAA